MRRLLLIAGLLFVSHTTLQAQEPFPWLKSDKLKNVTLHAPGKLADGVVVQVDGDAKQTTTPIIAVLKPSMPSHRYVLKGRVKFEGVEGHAYLELLSVFAEKKVYYTRTLAESGVLGKFVGTSDWREVELPFASDPGLLPEQINVNVVLSGKGTIYVAPLTVAALPDDGSWWNPRISGILGGGIGGSFAVIGAIVGLLAAFGAARGLVLKISVALLLVGLASLGLAGYAVSLGQPTHVVFPLFLIGGVGTVVFAFCLRILFRSGSAKRSREYATADY
jgi:hypothetical protein